MKKTETLPEAAIESRGVHFDDKKEEAYFTVTATLPRVGPVSVRFIADRYVARTCCKTDDCVSDQWTEWRHGRSEALPHGVGEKGGDLLERIAEGAITVWLQSAHYKHARSLAIAHFIKREAQGRYALTTGHARELLAIYAPELRKIDYENLKTAFLHIDKATALLDVIGND